MKTKELAPVRGVGVGHPPGSVNGTSLCLMFMEHVSNIIATK